MKCACCVGWGLSFLVFSGVFAVACGEDRLGDGPMVIEEDEATISVSRVVVEPQELLIAVHESRQLRVEAQGDGGEVVDVGLAWASEDEEVATVNGDGQVVGIGAGQTTIIVEAGSRSAKVVVTVRALEYRSVAVGVDHSCAVAWGGDVYCWGSNGTSQLGRDLAEIYSVPVKVDLPEAMASVTAAKRHSCALSNEGQAYCWGMNSYQQLGVGSSSEGVVLPTALAGPRYQSIVAGEYHTCGLTLEGDVYCWGDNTDGVLGVKGSFGSSTPQKVPLDSEIQQVVVGKYGTCVLGVDGKAFCFGDNGGLTLLPFEGERSFVPMRVGGDALFSSLALGSYTVCGLTLEGVTLCWGEEVVFSRGRAEVATYLPLAIDSTERFVGLVGAEFSFCGLKDDGELHCWGSNGYGGLGDGTTQKRLPGAVTGGHRWSSVALGDEHSCAIDVDGALWCWGNNPYGQVGDGRTVVDPEPVRVAGESLRLEKIMSSNTATCGFEKFGNRVLCWGGSSNGQLGNLRVGEHAGKPTPAQYPDKQWFRLSMAYSHSCGVTALGKAYCWGSNRTWQIGNGFTGPANWAISEVKSDVEFSAIFTGDNHTCALDRWGKASCWGLNNQGQLGSNVANGSPTPVAVSSDEGFQHLALGNEHTCGLRDDGIVSCWGSNAFGGLGSSSAPARSSVPIVVPFDEQVVAVKSGTVHSCALNVEGVLYCWGYNGLASLGNGSYEPVSGPVKVEGGPWVDFDIGGWTSCARNAEDKLYCWGYNVHRQVTSQAFLAVTAPHLMKPGFPVREYSVGGGFVCALDEGGHPHCWGLNSVGELGNDANYFHVAPTRVVSGGG